MLGSDIQINAYDIGQWISLYCNGLMEVINKQSNTFQDDSRTLATLRVISIRRFDSWGELGPLGMAPIGIATTIIDRSKTTLALPCFSRAGILHAFQC